MRRPGATHRRRPGRLTRRARRRAVAPSRRHARPLTRVARAGCGATANPSSRRRATPRPEQHRPARRNSACRAIPRPARSNNSRAEQHRGRRATPRPARRNSSPRNTPWRLVYWTRIGQGPPGRPVYRTWIGRRLRQVDRPRTPGACPAQQFAAQHPLATSFIGHGSDKDPLPPVYRTRIGHDPGCLLDTVTQTSLTTQPPPLSTRNSAPRAEHYSAPEQHPTPCSPQQPRPLDSSTIDQHARISKYLDNRAPDRHARISKKLDNRVPDQHARISERLDNGRLISMRAYRKSLTTERLISMRAYRKGLTAGRLISLRSLGSDRIRTLIHLMGIPDRPVLLSPPNARRERASDGMRLRPRSLATLRTRGWGW